MDLKNIWVGEKLMIKSSRRIGFFIGINAEGKARIKSENSVFIVSSNNLEVIPEQEYIPNIHTYLEQENHKIEQNSPKIKITVERTIDLHIDKLAPYMANELPGRILEYQISKSKQFIRHALDRNYPHITIIHGKGQGILKREIEHILKDFHQVKFTFSKNGGGAIEIWL